MTAAVFGKSDKQRASDRRLIDELQQQPMSLLMLGSFTVLILVIGQLSSSIEAAATIAVLFTIGMTRLLGQRRATSMQTASIGAIHLGVALLIAGMT